jgi:C-terminal processing protease CtpA/Prc
MIFKPRTILIFALSAFILWSCADDLDDNLASGSSVKNFVYRGMNAFYLYKPDVPVLANDRFETVGELESYHEQFETPEEFFESLVFDRSTTDRFSIIVSDYVALENALSGNRQTNGMEFGLVAENGSATDVFGYVRYVLPNSSAADENVERGMIFNSIDGTRLSRSNFNDLLSNDSYTIGLADLNNGVTTSNGIEIDLTKAVLQEDPILVSNVITQGSQKIGYLMYNSFLSQFDNELNSVFADFRNQGITNLVLDLRYNGGGSVNTAIILGSLIAGNPTTDVYSTEEWNPEIQALLQADNPEQLTSFFVNSIPGSSVFNAANLPKVHIITTQSTASASELVINSLAPYIDVVQVGDDTAGKFQASITLYDSPNFRRNDANPAHRYAMQPLVFKSVNAVGNTDYFDGLAPDIDQRENFENLGVLGDVNEPLLLRCLQDIALNGSLGPIAPQPSVRYEELNGSNSMRLLGNEMWKENVELNE